MTNIIGVFTSYDEQKKTSKAGKEFTDITVLIDTGEKYDPIVKLSATAKAAEYLKTQPYGTKLDVQFNIKSTLLNGKNGEFWMTDLKIYHAKVVESQGGQGNDNPY